jgi:hypothetical protein
MSESFSQYPFPDGEVSAPEAAGTLSPSGRLNSEIVGQSVEAKGRLSPAEARVRRADGEYLTESQRIASSWQT